MRFAIAKMVGDRRLFVRSLSRYYPSRTRQYIPATWTEQPDRALSWANRSTAERHLLDGCEIVEVAA